MDAATRDRLQAHYRFSQWPSLRPAPEQLHVFGLPFVGLPMPGWTLERRRELALDPHTRWIEWLWARGRDHLCVSVHECRCADSALELLLGNLTQGQVSLPEWRDQAAGEVAFSTAGGELAFFTRGNLLVQVSSLTATALTGTDTARHLDDSLMAGSDVAIPLAARSRSTRVSGNRLDLPQRDEHEWHKVFIRDGQLRAEADGFVVERAGPQPARVRVCVVRDSDIVDVDDTTV